MKATDRIDAPTGLGFAAAVTLAMSASTFAMFALGTLAPFITDDLGLSRSELGSLTAVMFVVGALGSPVAGRAVDAFGGRPVVIALAAAAGTGFVMAGVAPAYGVLVAAVAVAGIAVACGNPSTNKLVAAKAPPGRRGLVMGVKQSGVQLGGVVAGVALPAIAAAAGWRAAMLASAIVPAAALVAAKILVPPDRPGPAPPPASARGLRRALGWLAGYAFLMGMSVAVIGAYLTLYAHEELGYTEAAAGLVAALMGAVGFGARILWGRLSDAFRTTTTLLAALAATSVASQLVLWAAAGTPWLVWLGAAGTGASSGAWNGVGMVAIVSALDERDAGRGSGLVLLAFYGGYVVSPVLFGLSLDHTGSYDLGWAAVTASYAGAAAIATARLVRRGPGPADA